MNLQITFDPIYYHKRHPQKCPTMTSNTFAQHMYHLSHICFRSTVFEIIRIELASIVDVLTMFTPSSQSLGALLRLSPISARHLISAWQKVGVMFNPRGVFVDILDNRALRWTCIVVVQEIGARSCRWPCLFNGQRWNFIVFTVLYMRVMMAFVAISARVCNRKLFLASARRQST